ncbi:MULTISPECIES: cytochrome P450 [unclassified Streptomyces]|uniref:cytochrome P450 n=1 Tax=unclassified Streptomyces TaxID=2593676 RepID=UPI002251599C|nr:MULTISPECIES: cytochrome P450 [unclassified Streptomyces]MCX4524146.1 cytochrome P450 [Streptomyces sp. NBC_01551]MCX4545335.1 cytochrome P450 [Streptomyces sp. NBC_01565]
MYDELRRQHGSVAPVLLQDDVPAWLVLGHREILEVMRNPKQYSSDSRVWKVQLAPTSPLLPITAWQPLVAFADGHEHARLRAAITDSLGRFRRRGIRSYVVRYTEQLIGEFAGNGKADLVSDFAEKLPALVVGRLFGVPEKDAPAVGVAVRDMVKGTATALESNTFVVGVLTELVRRRKSSPGEDFTSWLLSHESDLSDHEAMEHLRHAMVAAIENTTNLIASTLRMVLTHPRFRASLSGGSMTLPDGLDQVLWDDPPLIVLPTRWATADTQLGSQQIRAGDLVMLGLAAGNVDPEIRPDLTTPVHGNRSHLAFGSGPHACPGEDIGRAIAETGIDTLLARLPDIQLVGEESDLRVSASLLSSRLDNLPVHFTPRPTGNSAKPEAGPTAKAGVAAPAVRIPSPPAAGTGAGTGAGTRRPWWRSLLSGRR